jgi:hypothetical protein
MPLLPKLVLATLTIGLALTVTLAFAQLDVGRTVGIVLQSAILIGLYTQQTAAWLAARWLTLIAAVVLTVGLALTAPSVFYGETRMWMWAVVAVQSATAWVLFGLLGCRDSRAYFHAPRKA